MKRFGCLIAGGVAAVFVLILVLVMAGSYNGLVQKEATVSNELADVETQYQRRFELIPNLVSAVQGFFNQEQNIFNAITQARAQIDQAQDNYKAAQTAGDISAIEAAASDTQNALGQILVIVEDTPQIKSDALVIDLMDELAGSENRISIARMDYNAAVKDYNTAIKTFPNNILAGTFGFTTREYFQSSGGADKPPIVTFT